MDLKRFEERNNKKIGIIVFTIVCIFLVVGVVFYRTFAIFEVQTNQNVIHGNIEDIGDLEFAFYIDGDVVKTAPIKSEEYIFDEENSSCTNGASVYWDYQRWAPYVLNLTETKTKCYLKFKKEYSEAILNGAVPKLKEGLTPVTIDNDGTVRKADITKEWYRYQNKQWANAVITQNSYELLGSNVHEATKQDGYVHLDGQDDYIDLGLADYDFHDKLTLAMNVNFDEVPNDTADYNLFGNWESAGGGIYLQRSYFMNSLSINSQYIDIRSNDEVVQHTDYTVVVTYDGSKIKMWVNGRKQENEISASGNIKMSPAPFFIGANPDANGSPTKFGSLNVKQAAIFNRAIDDNEVADISNNFKITNGEGLLKYVDFTSKTYENNEVISEDNIESYFVWIPRYSYQIFNDELYTGFTTIDPSKVQKINITFETKDATLKNGKLKNEWLTHPAFTSFDVNGMWVGKFEPSYKGATKKEDVQINEINSKKLMVKPNTYSWRNINVANAFYTCYDYNRKLESHMMKNTEWGAVTYLMYSDYGQMSNLSTNDNTENLTGFSQTNNAWNTLEGGKASTTGNITGIYDMAGGGWEFVSAVIRGENNEYISGPRESGSGFVGIFSDSQGGKTELTKEEGGKDWLDDRYYDFYKYNTVSSDYSHRILGDATGELGPFQSNKGSWFQLHSIFIQNASTWFIRGGLAGSNSYSSGIFAFSCGGGSAYTDETFRLVLMP